MVTLDTGDGSEDDYVRRDHSSSPADWRLKDLDCPGEAELWHDPTRFQRQSVQALLSFTHLQLAHGPDLLHLEHVIWFGLEGKIETNAMIGLNRQEAEVSWLSIGCPPCPPSCAYSLPQVASSFEKVD